MDPLLLVLVLGLAILLVVGAPIAVALGAPSIVYIILKGLPLELGVQRMFNGMDQFLLLAIPLFMYAGEIMNVGGLTTRLVNLSNAVLGRLPGSLAQVSLLTNMLLAGISGSSMADASAIGTLLIPRMAQAGYTRAFAAAIIAAGAIVGPIIPPSVVFILYAVLADVSVIDLFLGGVFPGALIILCLMMYVHFIASPKGFPKGTASTIHEKLTRTLHALPVLALPVLLVGGIRVGLFTPIEGAACTVAYALVLSFFYREISIRSVIRSSINVGHTVAEVLVLVGSATIFSWILVSEQVPLHVANAITTITNDRFVVLLLINIALLIAGMFLDGFSCLIIFVPIVKPIAYAMGVDPIHLGIIMCVNIQVGIITPPVGLNLFITTKIAQIPFSESAREIVPLVFVTIVALALITYVPALSVALPYALK